jgi:hypothetical protein
MDQTVIFNGLIVMVIALFTLLVGGGIAAFVTIGRQNKANLELAYKALPPEWQAFLRDLITGIHQVVDLADEVTTPDTTTTTTTTTTTPPVVPTLKVEDFPNG